mgnify:CR=1 FL=1
MHGELSMVVEKLAVKSDHCIPDECMAPRFEDAFFPKFEGED